MAGPTPQYLVKYNNYVLPGYAQSESFDSEMNLADHYGAYIDGSPTEETGLANKNLAISMKVWECNSYLEVKNKVELAATMLRSYRSGFAPLYVQYSDRHYDALVKTIQLSKQAGTSVRTADYDVIFECRPWLIGNTIRTLSGTGTVDTDQVARTIDDGGWAPTTVTVTGTDVTIQGFTDDAQSTGLVEIEGSVTSMIIDTEAFTATMGGINRNDLMLNTDYRLFIGPGKTTFTVTGASSCTITYYDRWYI